MESKPHLHSMIVHVVVASLPLAAAAWLLARSGIAIGRFGPELWNFIAIGALAVTLAGALPATVTGVAERNHMHVRWHRSHAFKLALSVALIIAVGAEIAAWVLGARPDNSPGWLLLLVVVVNNLLNAGLIAIGLKMTLGRFGWGSASYTPDMYRRPPVDILEENATYIAELPKTIEPHVEKRSA